MADEDRMPVSARFAAVGSSERDVSAKTPHAVLVVTNNLGGGTGTHLVGLLEHLEREGWQPAVLCQGARSLDTPPGVPLIDDLPSGKGDRFPLYQLRRFRQLRRTVRERGCELLHAYFFWPIIFGRILKRRGVITHLVENREDQGFDLGASEYRLLRLTADIPDRIICVSEAVRDVVLEREGVEGNRAVVVRNGVRLPERFPPAAEREAVRRELGFQPAHRLVGMVANLNRAVKGVHHFLDAMPLILERVPEARFLILGGGPDEEPLKARSLALGVADRVMFAGFRPDIERYYPLMDVSVLTSLSEGLSITILESMSFGLPVVATRVGGNPEVVQEGRSGLLVPPADPRAFAEAVVRVLEDDSLRERMGREGRRIVEKEFDLSRVASRYEEVYLDVLGGGRVEP